MDVVDLPLEEKLFQMKSAIFKSFPDDIKWTSIYDHIWQELFPGKTALTDAEDQEFVTAVLEKYGQIAVDWITEQNDLEYQERKKEAEEDGDLWDL